MIRTGIGRLILGCLAIASLWLLVLPRVALWEPVRASTEFLDQRGIDPSAMYYTDLEAMSNVRAEIDRKREEHPDAFWSPRQ